MGLITHLLSQSKGQFEGRIIVEQYMQEFAIHCVSFVISMSEKNQERDQVLNLLKIKNEHNTTSVWQIWIDSRRHCTPALTSQ